jgi:hypothetical protein
MNEKCPKCSEREFKICICDELRRLHCAQIDWEELVYSKLMNEREHRSENEALRAEIKVLREGLEDLIQNDPFAIKIATETLKKVRDGK